jgi:hypothetical protein
MVRFKYPRTWHLPWSPGATSDDVTLDSVACFSDRRVIVTEKMDGENTTLYRDHLHARSLDSAHHPSRNWVKAMHGEIAHLIPDKWRVCGENLYARHSLGYDELPSYFLLFSIWSEANICLSWDDTIEWAELLGLSTVPVLYDGVYDEDYLRAMNLDLKKAEGYVVRLAECFHYDDFRQSIAKWVRAGHVQTDEHWMHKDVIANSLADPEGDEQ